MCLILIFRFALFWHTVIHFTFIFLGKLFLVILHFHHLSNSMVWRYKIYVKTAFSRIIQSTAVHHKNEVMNMSYIAPAVQAKFESLSIDLKNEILERNVQINTIYDLIRVLEEIVNEGSWLFSKKNSHKPGLALWLFFNAKTKDFTNRKGAGHIGSDPLKNVKIIISNIRKMTCTDGHCLWLHP